MWLSSLPLLTSRKCTAWSHSQKPTIALEEKRQKKVWHRPCALVSSLYGLWIEGQVDGYLAWAIHSHWGARWCELQVDGQAWCGCWHTCSYWLPVVVNGERFWLHHSKLSLTSSLFPVAIFRLSFHYNLRLSHTFVVGFFQTVVMLRGYSLGMEGLMSFNTYSPIKS